MIEFLLLVAAYLVFFGLGFAVGYSVADRR